MVWEGVRGVKWSDDKGKEKVLMPEGKRGIMREEEEETIDMKDGEGSEEVPVRTDEGKL